MKYLLTILLTLGIWSNSLATTTTITSLPYTFSATDMSLTDTDTLVLQGTKLSSTTDGITLTSTFSTSLTDLVLNLGTDTVIFGTGGGDNNVGVSIGSSGVNDSQSFGIKIVGGVILHQPTGTTANRNNCLEISGGGLVLDSITANIKGDNGHTLYSTGSNIYSDTVRNCTFSSNVDGFSSRCNYDATVVYLADLRQSSLYANSADLHWYVDNVTITDGPHVGLLLIGREGGTDFAVGKVVNCNITTDGRNDFYTSPSTTCLSAANPYGIVFRNFGSGCLIYNNTITSGTTYAGNRGILLERSDSSDVGDPLIVRQNTLDLHEGPSAESSPPIHGIRIRYAVGAMIIDSNNITVTVDGDAGTTYMGDYAHAIRMTSGTALETNVVIRNNRIRAIALDNGVSDCTAIVFDGLGADSIFTVENNYITSSKIIYQYGEFSGQSLAQYVRGDTVGYESFKLASASLFHVGYLGNNWDCSGNVAENNTYLSGIYDTSISFQTNGTLDIRLKRTINLTINGNNSLPVNNATVYVVNNLGDTVLNTTTSATGLTSVLTSYWWESRTVVDTTNYEPFTLVAIKSGDTTKTTNFNLQGYSGQRDTTLVLTATAGSGLNKNNKIRGGYLKKGKI